MPEEEPLNGYTIEFFKVVLFGCWSWRITTPDDRELAPLLTVGWADRGAAERAALRRCEVDAARVSVTALELRAKLGGDQ